MAQASLTDIIRALVDRFVSPRLDPLAFYDAEVKAMNDDGTVDIKPDSSRWGAGLSRVPIRHGLPGVTVRVKQGARVRLSFAGGDERNPFVSLWDPGSLETITVVADTSVRIDAPQIIWGTEDDARPVARAGDLIEVYLPAVPPLPAIPLQGYISNASQKVRSS